MYTRLDYQILNYTNLTIGATSNLAQVYTTTFNPINTSNIVFGWNWMEFNGYATFGFEFSINLNPVGTNYAITLTNRLTTSAIPRLYLTVLLPSEFTCLNNETLINTALSLC